MYCQSSPVVVYSSFSQLYMRNDTKYSCIQDINYIIEEFFKFTIALIQHCENSISKNSISSYSCMQSLHVCSYLSNVTIYSIYLIVFWVYINQWHSQGGQLLVRHMSTSCFQYVFLSLYSNRTVNYCIEGVGRLKCALCANLLSRTTSYH